MTQKVVVYLGKVRFKELIKVLALFCMEENMKKIKEIIVVEGKDDTVAIKRAVNADTIETNGSAVNESCIEQVRLAQETRGVIIFTDPDFPGQKIRNIISEQVKGCKHAFLTKKEALPKSGRGIGVEHASPEAIRNALKGRSING